MSKRRCALSWESVRGNHWGTRSGHVDADDEVLDAGAITEAGQQLQEAELESWMAEIGAWYERHASAGKLASRRVRRHALGAPVPQRLNERVLDRLFRHADVANRAASAPRIRVASSR
jgi:hypothetical protein